MNEITKKVKVKAEVLNILDEINSRVLDGAEKEIKTEYVQFEGETEEYTDWKTGEIKVRDKWGDRPKENLSELDKLKLEAIETVRKALEKLI